MKKFRSLFAVILAIGLMLAVVACDGGGKTDGTWTVKVLDVNGNPYTSVMVQPCVFDNGKLFACYGPFALDADGSIELKLKEHVAKEDAEELEIHLAKLPAYLTYDHTTIKKGESKTVQAKFKTESDLSTKGGSGTSADPYTVKSGREKNPITGNDEQIVYGFKLAAEQKIIFAVTVYVNDEYTIDTYGVDAKITLLNKTEEGFEATDKTGKGTLDFEVEDEAEAAEAAEADENAPKETVVYFEVSLDGEGADKLGYIWIK